LIRDPEVLTSRKPILKDKGIRWVVLNHFLYVKIEVRVEKEPRKEVCSTPQTHTGTFLEKSFGIAEG